MQIVLKDNKTKIDMKGDIPLKIIEAVKAYFRQQKFLTMKEKKLSLLQSQSGFRS